MEGTEKAYYVPKEDRIFGACIMQIRLENHAEYLKWRKYNGGDSRWDFMTNYPAIMQKEYEFHTTTDLDILTRKVVQLLQMGFNVRAVNWRLKEFESQLKKEMNL